MSRCKPNSCAGCAIESHGTDFSQPSGKGSSGVMIIGEASGQWEQREQRPFVEWAQAGSVLTRIIKLAGYDRDMFTISNVVRCRPRNDWLEKSPWEFAAINHCRPNLDMLIAERRPRCIWALGGTALRELTGHSGKNRGVTILQGYVLEGPNGIPVIASVHPALIARGGTEFYYAVAQHCKTAVRIAKEGFTAKAVQYSTHPSLDEARSFELKVKDSPNLLLTYDIETPNSRDLAEDERDDDPSYVLESIQFSLAPQTGIFFPATNGFLEIARRIMSYGNRKAGWNNKGYDDPRLRHNGFVINGLIEDFMHKWHAIQSDLPQNLQFAGSFLGMDIPWKHLSGSDPEHYGCCDVDAPQRADKPLEEALKRFGHEAETQGKLHCETSYNRYVRDFYGPVLTPMSERGIPINNAKRVAFGNVLDKAQAELFAKMQDHVPLELRNLHPKQGYKKEPKDTTGLVQREFGEEKIMRWCRIEPFKPSAGKEGQLIRYIKFMKHPVPKKPKETNPDGSKKDTTEAKELERLFVKTGDPLYKWVKDYRATQTMKSTFVDGYAPGNDGRVHTTFTLAPAQWQLSSRNPNVQNAPTHVGLADNFLECMEAPQDHMWVVADKKSFHPAMLAFEASDTDYLRIVRLDVHSYLTAHFMKESDRDRLLGMCDEDLRERLAQVKKAHKHVRDYKCKRVICGWGNGEGYRLCFQQWREYFENETECKKLFQLLEALFPKTTKRKIQMTYEASPYPEHGGRNYLISRYGALRWFHETYKWDGKSRKLVAGADYNKAQAFYGPNDAFGDMRDNMWSLTEGGYAERYQMVNNVHDALYFLPHKSLVPECLNVVRSIMQAPNKKLIDPVVAPDGMWVETGFKIGRNLGSRSETNPDGLEELKMERPKYPLFGPLNLEVATNA